MGSSALVGRKMHYHTHQTQMCHKGESCLQQDCLQSVGSQWAETEVQPKKTHSKHSRPLEVCHSAEKVE